MKAALAPASRPSAAVRARRGALVVRAAAPTPPKVSKREDWGRADFPTLAPDAAPGAAGGWRPPRPPGPLSSPALALATQRIDLTRGRSVDERDPRGEGETGRERGTEARRRR